MKPWSCFWKGSVFAGILRVRVGPYECVESLAGCGGSLGCSDSAGSSEALTCWITTPAWSTLWSLANMKWSSISAASAWTEWSHGCVWLAQHILLHGRDRSARTTSAWNHPERMNPPFQIPFIFVSAPTRLSVSLPLTSLSSPLSDPQGVIFFFFFFSRCVSVSPARGTLRVSVGSI